ncbi:unnamed protein product [Toxocara canis]|uniref:Transmembrane protein n=1 Tax=Toxocara canis TaxID=6265 RepID=A0A183UQV2_TOXCA|nr:unnamed protein product [Toxocara canis]
MQEAQCIKATIKFSDKEENGDWQPNDMQPHFKSELLELSSTSRYTTCSALFHSHTAHLIDSHAISRCGAPSVCASVHSVSARVEERVVWVCDKGCVVKLNRWISNTDHIGNTSTQGAAQNTDRRSASAVSFVRNDCVAALLLLLLVFLSPSARIKLALHRGTRHFARSSNRYYNSRTSL